MFRKVNIDYSSEKITGVNGVRNVLINKGLTYFSAIAPIGIVVPLMRLSQGGWNLVNCGYLFLSLFLAFQVWIVSFFRDKISYAFRAGILIGTIFIISIFSSVYYGLFSGGILLLVVTSVMATIAFGARVGVSFCIFAIGYVSVLAVSICRGWYVLTFDPVEYAVSPVIWIAIIITLSLFMPVCILAFGSILHYLQVSHDKLHASYAQHERLANNLLGTILYRHNAEGIFMYASSSVEQVLGYSCREFMSHYTSYLTDHPVNKLAEQFTNGSLSGVRQPIYEAEMLHKDGHRVWVEVAETPVFDGDGNVVAVEGIIYDVTARRQAIAENKYLQQYLSSIIDSMPSLLIGLDNQGIITQWNNEAERVFGIAAEVVLNKSMIEVLPDCVVEWELVLSALETGEVVSKSKLPRIINGKNLFVDITAYPLRSEDVDGAVIRIDNVSERVRLDQMMVQSEKMMSVGGLAAGMAHEINNPLSIVTQCLQNVMRRMDPAVKANCRVAEAYELDLNIVQKYMKERKVSSFIESSKDAIIRAAGIVKNMLSFSYAADSSQGIIDLALLVEKTIELGASDYDMKKKYDFKFVEIIKEYESDLPPIMGCEGEIEQVLLNLFKNALQAIEGKMEQSYKPVFHIRLARDGYYVRLEIQDNGPGISDEVRAHIFDPFYTTKPIGVGTGLGLYVSYSIITQNHSGIFEVESTEGEGAIFIIRLPIYQKSNSS